MNAALQHSVPLRRGALLHHANKPKAHTPASLGLQRNIRTVVFAHWNQAEPPLAAVALCFDFIRMKLMATQKQGEYILEAERSRTKPPPLYKVLLLNDDFTPMDFVIVVLQKFFGMDRERATRVMLQVHREGMGVCGVFPKDVAATKVELVVSFARQHQHPLACVMEEN